MYRVHFSFFTIFITVLFSSCVKQGEVSNAKISKLSVESGETYNFGYTPLATSKEFTVTLENTGDYTLTNLKTKGFSDGSAFSFKGATYPGTGGNCNDRLQVNSSCTLVIEFTPTSSGIWDERIKLEFLNGVASDAKHLQFSGIAGTLPKIELVVDDPSFGVIEVQEVKNKTITVKNLSELPVSGIQYVPTLNGEINYLGGVFPGAGGNCDSDLEGFEECTLVFSFEPTENKSHSTKIEVIYNDYVKDQAVAMTLSGQSLDIIAKLYFYGTDFLSFGSVVEGVESVRTIQIRNEGFANASNVTFEFDHTDYYLKESRCPATISPAGQCEVDIAYKPTPPNYWTQNGNVEIAYNNIKNEVKSPSIKLKGRATKIANATIEESLTPNVSISAYDFGIKGQNSKSYIALKIRSEAGTGTLMENIQVSTLSAPFKLEEDNCPNTLSSGFTCNITVSYTPSEVGNDEQSMNISYFNGFETKSIAIQIKGSAQAAGLLRITELERTYPLLNIGARAVGGTYTYPLTLTNEGVIASTNITPPTLMGALSYAGGFPGSSGTCPSTTPFTLNAGDSCTFVITYSPTASEVVRDELNQFAFDDGIGSVNYDFFISRVARMPARLIAINDESEEILETDFGPVSVGNPLVKTATFKNIGQMAARSFVYTFSDTNFDFDGGEVNATGGTCPDGGMSLSPGESCTIYIRFSPQSLGLLTSSYTASYENGLNSTSHTHTLKGEGQNLAYVTISPNDENDEGVFAFPRAVYPGGSSSQIFTLTNSGQASATSLGLTNIISPFSVGPATNCTTVLAAGASCDMEIELIPTYEGNNSLIPKLSYHDGNKVQEQTIAIKARSVPPSRLVVYGSEESPYKVNDTEVNKTNNKVIALQNTGSYPAQVTNISSSNPMFSVFTETCTSEEVGKLLLCYVSIKFAPPDTTAGQTHSTNISITYDDGVALKSLNFVIEGNSEAPSSFHQGWTKILAFGSTVNNMETNANDKKVILEWNDMVPSQAYSISGYNVYRKSQEDIEFNYSSPIATNISTSSKTYTDASVSENTRYIYQVRPVILGTPSRVVEDYGTIEVYVPPSNMSFIHRRMGNKSLCEQMAKAYDRSSFNSCSYTGQGSNASAKLDIGQHVLYDRYEIGQNGLPQTDQIPRSDFSQSSLDYQCASTTILVDNDYVEKRVPSRMEYNMASRWPAGTNIETVENGAIFTQNCNSNSTELESNENNSNCVSEFGIYNLVGNAWEVLAERMIGGIGPTSASQRLYEDNMDFDALNINTIDTNDIEDTACLDMSLGHPVPEDSGSCPDGSIASSTSGINNDYFWHPTYFGASLAQLFAGGSYDSTTKSGRFTSAWVPLSYGGGGRCVAHIPIGAKFPSADD